MNLLPVDLSFALQGDRIHSDSRYQLLAAISRMVPAVHGGGSFAIHPIRGKQVGGRMLALTPQSRLTIRTATDHIGLLLKLADTTLQLGDFIVRVDSVPSVHQLVPATTLRSHLVTIKRTDRKVDPASFTESARKQLEALGVSPVVEIELPERRSAAGEIRSAKRTLRIKDREVIGYEVRLHGLAADESLVVQAHGVGGRRAMGCGLFRPFHPISERETDNEVALEVSGA